MFQFVGLAAVIIAAGAVLARCADAIANATGLGKLLVGSVLLAGATSLPELTVDLSAVRLGLPDLAVGDLLGSSLMNLMILALLDLSRHSRGKMLSRSAAAHALSGLFSISLTAIVGLAVTTTHRVPSWTLGGVHAWLWLVAVAYFAGVRMVYLDQRIALRIAEERNGPLSQKHGGMPLRQAAIGFVVAAAAIFVAGPILAEKAGEIAEISGLGGTFIGTTLVAFCTSLLELASSLAALRIGAADLAIGNVFGSNAFNMLLLWPLDLAHPGPLFAATSSTHAISILATVVATCLVIMGQLYHVESRARLIEPDATLVILVILAALALVYAAA
jgi:cation:H+ antiporter